MSAAQHFYQAIGGLLATLVVAADGTKFLDTGSSQYSVFVPEQVQKKYQEKYQGEQVGWRVYPQFVDESLVFDVVAFAASPKTEPGQFTLQGDWVSAGQLQIWRNAQAGKVNAQNWQPRLLPISWSDAPPPDGSFWQLKAQLVDNTLKIVEAAGPFPHPPRLEKLPKFRTKKQKQQQHQTEQQATKNTETIDWEDITPVSGKLELTIKINTLPQVKLANGQCHFKIDCNGKKFQVSVKPKQWAKLETANTNFEQWVAALTGKLGAATTDGFILESPNIQVFERQVSKQVEPTLDAAAQARHQQQSYPTE